MKQWQEIKSEFETDGTLRDIYIFEGDVELWDSFLKLISSSEYRTEFNHGEVGMSLPLSFAQIKVLQETDPTTLFVWVGENIQVNCHFFIETEIELDVSPHDIGSEEAFHELVSFLSWLSSSLNRKVCLTHEGSPDMKIIEMGQ